MLMVQPLISYEFPAINLTPKAQIHTEIQDGKYAANMRTRQSISQSVTGTTISDDVNNIIGLYNLARYRSTSRLYIGFAQ